ncbi:MAG: cupin domain-containing protein [Rhodobacterales bacterium]|nr:cupin domain-containing protein [Rhodobacterales bacterium]
MTDLIGGIGLTHLKVYDQRPGPDGETAGCPHVHALTDEAYYGLSGTGAIDLHDPDTGYRRVPLQPGAFVQFPPGTLHRSVSFDGLEVLAIMGNSGLAERGDARIYFGPAVDDDPAEYTRLRNLSARGLDGALERRDAACHAHMALMEMWRTDRDAYAAELRRFSDRHRADLAPLHDALSAVLAAGPEMQAAYSRQRLEALPGALGETPPVVAAMAGQGGTLFGMCGLLRQVDPDGEAPL